LSWNELECSLRSKHDSGDVKAAGILLRCICLINVFPAWFRKLGCKVVAFKKILKYITGIITE